MSEDSEAVNVSQKFRTCVQQFVELDDKIKSSNKAISELKKVRDTHKQYILDYMEDQDIDELNVSGGKLIRRKACTKVPLNKEYIEHACTQIGLRPEEMESMIMACFDNRTTRTRTDLSRRSNRKKKS